jgi:hypothetical protein
MSITPKMRAGLIGRKIIKRVLKFRGILEVNILLVPYENTTSPIPCDV